MTVVVDIGCMTYGADESVAVLAERFQPDLLLAFDPHPALVEGVSLVGETVVIRRRLAAWTHDGVMPYAEAGIRSGYSPDGADVPCFDLAALLRVLPDGFVLKLDCEGAEYPLLKALQASGQDARADRILVEWHDHERAHGLDEAFDAPMLACAEVETW